MLGLHGCVWAFSSCSEQGLLLRAVAFLVLERGLSSVARRLPCCSACGVFPPTSPALVGGFSTTGPPGKSCFSTEIFIPYGFHWLITLWYLMDCSPPGSSVHVILQARIPEWAAIFFSRESSQPRNWTQGLNPGLLHCRQILYHLSYQGSPKRERELLNKHYKTLLLNSLWSFFFFLEAIEFYQPEIYYPSEFCKIMFIGRYLSEWVLSRFSHFRLLMTPGTVGHQAPLSMGFSWQEYWSGLSCPPPGDLPNHLCKSLWTPRKLYIFHLLQNPRYKETRTQNY